VRLVSNKMRVGGGPPPRAYLRKGRFSSPWESGKKSAFVFLLRVFFE
jgi:hypothetical protein